jgi:hypothetical protein
MLYRVDLAMNGFELTTLLVIGNDCTNNCKSNYLTITTTTAPSDRYVILRVKLKSTNTALVEQFQNPIQIKTDSRYNCNIVESGVKHHKPNLYLSEVD